MSNEQRVSPYQGLTPYTEADADYFFGREVESVNIVANLGVARLTILYGPSGVGKSSVLRAGVIHRLQQEAQANFAAGGNPELIPVYFNRWQSAPLQGLTQAIAAATQPYLPAIHNSPFTIHHSQLPNRGFHLRHIGQAQRRTAHFCQPLLERQRLGLPAGA